MTKSEYLDMRGFSEQDYALMTKDECAHLIGQSGQMNNMYAANDPKGKTFGPGAFVVKRSWAEQFQGEVDLQSEKPKENSIGAIPPIPPKPPIATKSVESETVDNDTISDFLSRRIVNLVNKGWDDEPKAKWLTKGDETISYEELEDLDNSDYTKLIIVKPEDPIEAKVEAKPFLCLNGEQYGAEKQCAAQCGYCESQEKNKIDDVAVLDISKAENISEKEAEKVEELGEVLNELEEQDFEEEINTETISDEDLQKEMSDDFEEEEISEAVEELKTSSGLEKIKEGSGFESGKTTMDIVEEAKKAAVEKDDSAIDDYEKAKTFDKPDQIKSDIVTGFFAELAALGFQQLNLTINKIAEDKLTIIVKPQNFSGDPAYDNISPLVLSGTIEELDNEFFNAINQPLKQVNGLMSNAKLFLKEVKKKEKETKAAEEKKKEIKKLVDSAKKFHTDDKNFDFKKSGASAKKKWDKVFALDSDNIDAKKGIAALEALASKDNSTLNLQ